MVGQDLPTARAAKAAPREKGTVVSAPTLESVPAVVSVPTVVLAAPADRERCFASLVTAFVADPLIRWMFPDAHQYLTWFPQVLRHYAGGAFDHGSAYRTVDCLSSSMWLPPGVTPDEQALGAVLQEGVEEGMQEEVFAFMEQVGNGHPDEPHWFLPAVGVDPMRQGQGYGSALMARSLERCDHDHAVAYLESSNPRNVPLYQRFGFEVTGRLQVGGSPTVVTMTRAAR